MIDRLKRELRGRIGEIGGVLVGEHIGGEVFRIVDISVQYRGGSVAHFVRDPEHHKAFLADFFARTNYAYQRFNYIGEWHSHPGFRPLPSPSDMTTMHDIVSDPEVGANFIVLIIARLHVWRTLEISATLFQRSLPAQSINVEIETIDEMTNSWQTVLCRFLDFIRR